MSSESTSMSIESSQQGKMEDIEKGAKTDKKARPIPHTEAYEKTFGPYWHGTCYGPVDGSTTDGVKKRWATKPEDLEKMPYLKHVKKLSRSWKHLEQLADFMEVGTTPLQWPLFEKNERERRIKRTKVKFIEYRPDIAPKVASINDHMALQSSLEQLLPEGSGPPPLRLFVVEDLSQRVIELLGSRFDIDPLFFREHIADYVWHNVRDTWTMPSSLLVSKTRRSWFQLRNVRLRYHHDEASFETARQDANMWNVLRRPDNDFNHWKYKDWIEGEDLGEEEVGDKEGQRTPRPKPVNDVRRKAKFFDENRRERKPKIAAVSILRTRTTIWIGKDPQCTNSGTVGVVLLDPTVSTGVPLWHDRTNWLPTLSMTDMSEQGANAATGTIQVPSTDQQSWFDDIVNMTTAYPWFEKKVGHKIEPKVLAYPTLYTICAEWLVVCDYVKTRLSQIEWEIEMPAVFRSKGDAIDSSLKRLHTWRRQIPVFRDMVTETMTQALPAAVRLTAGSSPQNDTQRAFADIEPDFDRILEALKELQARADRLTDIVVSEISIEDSKLGLEENHNLARLTWLATTFIPLSFVSAFFSMNEDVAALKYTYGWFFLAAIPFTAVIMLLGWLLGGGPLGKKLQEKKAELKKKNVLHEKFKLK